MADFDAMKDQWTDIEENDGIRLSWNVFPSSRMVRLLPACQHCGMLTTK